MLGGAALGEGMGAMQHVVSDAVDTLLDLRAMDARRLPAAFERLPIGRQFVGDGLGAFVYGAGDGRNFAQLLFGEGHPRFHFGIEFCFEFEIDRAVQHGAGRPDLHARRAQPLDRVLHGLDGLLDVVGPNVTAINHAQ